MQEHLVLHEIDTGDPMIVPMQNAVVRRVQEGARADGTPVYYTLITVCGVTYVVRETLAEIIDAPTPERWLEWQQAKRNSQALINKAAK